MQKKQEKELKQKGPVNRAKEGTEKDRDKKNVCVMDTFTVKLHSFVCIACEIGVGIFGEAEES